MCAAWAGMGGPEPAPSVLAAARIGLQAGQESSASDGAPVGVVFPIGDGSLLVKDRGRVGSSPIVGRKRASATRA